MPKYCEKFKKGSLEMLFLKLLSEGDFYGYELAKLFNHLSNNVITLSAGNMYPALYRLEEKGLISSYEKNVGKRMKRVYYHLTNEGRAELEEMLEDYKSVANATNAIINFRKEQLEEMVL